MTVSGYPGKAYGPSHAKQLARIELGDPSAICINVDNYVFYAVSWYIYNVWDIVPLKPNYGWPRLSADELYLDDSDPLGDDGSTMTVNGGAILDDQDFYAGSGCTPDGGFQPAGPTSAASPPPAPTPAYAPGTCSFHLTEMQTCTSDDKNLFAIIKLVDNNKADSGHTTVSDIFPVGESINVANPYQFPSKLPNTLTITGEHQKDYEQFAYGSLQWTSRDTKGPATCSNGE